MSDVHHHHHDDHVPEPAGLADPAPTGSGEIWTCPRHPQIRWVHPGNCPICGMKLVLKGGGK